MPKVNVYLPDELAAAVRQAGIPVSAVCQRALEDALRAVTAAREGTATVVPALPAGVTLGLRATPRLVRAVDVAFTLARSRGDRSVGTEHLLLGMLADHDNLGVRVLAVLEVAPDDVRADLEAAMGAGPGPAGTEEPGLDPAADAALARTTEEAKRLGHNYLGCEHLLLGLVAEPDGFAGRALRSRGLDLVVTRRAVTSALSGVLHARANPTRAPAAVPTDAVARALDDITNRLERIEARLGA